MENWLLPILIFITSMLLKLLFSSKMPTLKLPPGPTKLPIIGCILCLTASSFVEFEAIARSLHAKFGPIFTIYIGRRPIICITDRHLAYEALIRKGSIFADRPPTSGIWSILNSNQHNISGGSYGPTWRLLRRNLISGVFHSSQMKLYSHTRKRVLQTLIDRLKKLSSSTYDSNSSFSILGHFQYAVFSLFIAMCFGDNKLDDEKQIQEIMRLERAMLLDSSGLSVLGYWPKLFKTFFRNRWLSLLQLRKDQEDYLIPLIRERKRVVVNESSTNVDEHVLTYVDTILGLQLPYDEGRNLSEQEMVTLCNEFLNGGTDTTSTALEWIMANLVKHPHIQKKLFMEIKIIVGENEDVKEEDLKKIPYLKAIILEGLRRHPPGHFVVPHSMTEDATLGTYSIPKNATISFMLVEMGRDTEVWEDPMAFKPERFMDSEEVFDITGSREIKMMPFGAGRRICPGYNLAMLHLEYFVANLVWNFEWKALDGDDVDLSEKVEVSIVMKHPLKAQLSRRA
ncbi:cytochrome P450 family 89 subfamily A polypeptide 5 [Euphorbia peplus]|nr:cytochrome P450 family 89 subfamily A polypeptide 5 [Euphorbia peplus]